MFTRDNPYSYGSGERFRNIQHNYEKMRRVVLSEGYDKAWMIESDTIPPVDALAKLLEVQAPVASGLYVLRHGNKVPNVMQYGSDMNAVGSAMRWSEIRAKFGETVRTSGGCTGCTLIDRSALEGFSFITPKYKGPPDGPLMDHCFANRIPWLARLDVVCGHKDVDGTVLWPQDFMEIANG